MGLDRLTVDEAERLDLDAFLRATSLLGIGAAERLRQLAIRLERVSHGELPRAWLVVDRVYEHALRLEPDHGSVHHSRGVTAMSYAELADALRVERRLFDQAHSSLQEARAVDGDDAASCYATGLTCYSDPDRSTEEALGWFEAALADTPTHAWSRLYRAHCLHDLQRWEKAVQAYDEVPLGAFEGPRAWRVDLLKEQRAYCRLRAGDRDQALAEFEALLDLYEKEPRRAEWMLFSCIEEAAKGPLRKEIGERVDRLLQRAGLQEMTTLYRPVGQAELDLIAETGYRRFPPRLPEQPIFYPVCNEQYATEIAKKGNVAERGVGYVTCFEVRTELLDHYEIHIVGKPHHEEYWIPAEDLDDFNNAIVGNIQVIGEYRVSEGAFVARVISIFTVTGLGRFLEIDIESGKVAVGDFIEATLRDRSSRTLRVNRVEVVDHVREGQPTVGRVALGVSLDEGDDVLVSSLVRGVSSSEQAE
jgi:tetratricopeptide (TPR) repeat protein